MTACPWPDGHVGPTAHGLKSPDPQIRSEDPRTPLQGTSAGGAAPGPVVGSDIESSTIPVAPEAPPSLAFCCSLCVNAGSSLTASRTKSRYYVMHFVEERCKSLHVRLVGSSIW